MGMQAHFKVADAEQSSEVKVRKTKTVYEVGTADEWTEYTVTLRKVGGHVDYVFASDANFSVATGDIGRFSIQQAQTLEMLIHARIPFTCC